MAKFKVGDIIVRRADAWTYGGLKPGDRAIVTDCTPSGSVWIKGSDISFDERSFDLVIRSSEKKCSDCEPKCTGCEDHGCGCKLDEKPKLDLTKPVQTRAGLPVRILCTDGPGVVPVIGLIGFVLHRWSLLGEAQVSGPDFDLINVPPKPVSVSQTYYLKQHKKTGDAIISEIPPNSGRWKVIGKKTITITEGEGL